MTIPILGASKVSTAFMVLPALGTSSWGAQTIINEAVDTSVVPTGWMTATLPSGCAMLHEAAPMPCRQPMLSF